MNTKDTWDNWLLNQNIPIADFTSKPATIQLLDQVSAELGKDLPDIYRSLYLWSDGEQCFSSDKFKAFGYFGGSGFCDLNTAMIEWQEWNLVMAGESDLGDWIKAVNPEDSQKTEICYWSKYWLPFTFDFDGNGFAIDLNPGPQGTYGQVIVYGKNVAVRGVVAPDITQFFKFLSLQASAGRITIDEEEEKHGKIKIVDGLTEEECLYSLSED